MDADYFAGMQYKDYVIYKELEKREKNPVFKTTLKELIRQEFDDYKFWSKLSTRKEFKVSWITIMFFVTVRKIFGLTFTAKFLEGRERGMIGKYNAYLKTVRNERVRNGLKKIIAHEIHHEKQMINQIKEDKVKFMSSIVLGLNDGLIELTGALTGFSLALQSNTSVATVGLITGIAASLSMSSSAYLQARHEKGKNPVKAGIYTGVSYITVTLLLIAPFFITSGITAALITMLAVAIAIIACVSVYSAVLMERDVKKQLAEMLVFSLGTAAITFLIGSMLA